MTNLKCFFSIAAVLMTLTATVAMACQLERETLIYYSQTTDNETETLSTDIGNPGASVVVDGLLYSSVDKNGNPIPPSVGGLFAGALELLNPLKAIATVIFNFDNGDTIIAIGVTDEEAELPPTCLPIKAAVLTIVGGTGKHLGAQGQITVTHTQVNPDHHTHLYKFEIELLSMHRCCGK